MKSNPKLDQPEFDELFRRYVEQVGAQHDLPASLTKQLLQRLSSTNSSGDSPKKKRD